MSQGELYKAATRKTPEVVFRGGDFLIEGRSIPENPREFYTPLYDWILEKVVASDEIPQLEFAFDYINTASAKWIFLMLRDLTIAGKKYKVVWRYEKGDEDMLELGMMFHTLLAFPITTIEVDEIPGFRKVLSGE